MPSPVEGWALQNKNSPKETGAVTSRGDGGKVSKANRHKDYLCTDLINYHDNFLWKTEK